MSKTVWIIIAVVGGGFSMCCLAGMALALAAPDDAKAPATEGATAGGGGGLEGVWSSGNASAVSYKNLATGEFAPPSGTGVLLELKPGGDCTQSALMQSSFYGCTSYIFVSHEDCSWSFDGQTFTLELEPGDQRMKGCGGEVKEGKSKGLSMKAKATLTRDGNWEWLSLVDVSDNVETRYRREVK